MRDWEKATQNIEDNKALKQLLRRWENRLKYRVEPGYYIKSRKDVSIKGRISAPSGTSVSHFTSPELKRILGHTILPVIYSGILTLGTF